MRRLGGVHSIGKEGIVLILCILLGFALRYYAFDQKSLWVDEIHTFNDSRYDIKEQIKFYKENPTYLQAPLFFVLTHLFYPFPKPERDLRILPLIFGTLSIPMFYLLARLFSPAIAIPCTLSLTFMTYHVSLSQEARSYVFLMFTGMAGIYFLMKHLQTLKRRFLFPGAFCLSILVYLSYSSIPFIVFSQLLWFYRAEKNSRAPLVSSFFIFNGLILLFCAPWILFLAFHYKGQWMPQAFEVKAFFSFLDILYGIFHDWVPYAPLMITSVIIFVLAPSVSEERRNLLVLSTIFLLPIVSLFAFCKFIKITHFLSSRYFIGFLPFFLINLYLSIHLLEFKWFIHRKRISLTFLFLFLFIATHLTILPLYYRSEKQDFRRLVAYLKAHLKEGDKIFDADRMLIGILHYFRVPTEGRYYVLDDWKVSENEVEYRKMFTYQNKHYTVYHSDRCCETYLADGNRLWIISGTLDAKWLKGTTPVIFKGYFDGSFLNFERFPVDASMYLFLLDPNSPNVREENILKN